MIKIDFLSPIHTDTFKEKKLEAQPVFEKRYRIDFKKSHVIVVIGEESNQKNFKFIETSFKCDYDSKKIHGYILFKLIAECDVSCKIINEQ